MMEVTNFADYKKVKDLTDQARRLGFAIVSFIPMEMQGVDRDAFETWLKAEGRKVLKAMRQEMQE